MESTIIVSIIAAIAVFGVVLIQTPLQIEKARYSALRDEYTFTIEKQKNEINRLELRIRELELLADKEWIK